jgi:hypothetical protein
MSMIDRTGTPRDPAGDRRVIIALPTTPAKYIHRPPRIEHFKDEAAWFFNRPGSGFSQYYTPEYTFHFIVVAWIDRYAQ